MIEKPETKSSIALYNKVLFVLRILKNAGLRMNWSNQK